MGDIFGKALSKTGDLLNKANTQITSALDGEICQKLCEDFKIGAEKAAERYKSSGAQGAMERAGDKFDEMTGKTILEEMREAIKTQAIYNDTLATKLQEALDRIADLEVKARKP